MATPIKKPPLWDRICAVYSEARSIPEPERAALLARECAGDPDLEREVRILLQLQAPPSGFLEGLRPAAPPAPPAARSCALGDVFSGRFEVVRFLGSGGMGEVYEATDRDLGDAVAIKVLRSIALPEEAVTQRFRREIRLARRITHQNVCRVFDFARHQDAGGVILHYFVMELLDGETLSVRLARSGALDPALALDIARQMAAGLTAAHQAGIVHRDFKPANVMLTEAASGLRVAITDFGLASPVDASQTKSTLGSTGMLLGTPGYVAPEQLYGGPVTPATDIYAYGIVLHELIAGLHPRAPEARPGALPANWRRVIERCMQLDPKARFASVREACEALDRAAWRSWRPSRRQILITTGTAAAGVALFPAASRYYHQQHVLLPAGALVIVTPVTNTTGEPRFDGVTTALQESLAQSAHLNVWNPQRLGEVLRSMRVAVGSTLDTAQWREIAYREKAPEVIFSTVSRVGSGYVLSIHSERITADPRQPAGSADQSFPASGPDSLFEALRGAAGWIRTSAGENPAALAVHDRLPQDITSANWQALQLFSTAQTLNAKGQASDAILALRRAVDLDSEFAMGFMRLGDLLNSQRQSEEGYAHWRRAIALARSQRLSEHEQLNIESRYALDLRDFVKAQSVLLDWARKFPHDALAQELLASCLLHRGQYLEAVRRAREAEANFGVSIFATGVILHGLGASNLASEMEEPLAAMDRLSPSLWGPQMRGAAAAMREDYQSAENFFHKLASAGGESASRATSLLAVLAGDRGDLEGAAKLLRDGMLYDRSAGEPGFAAAKAAGLAFVEGALGNREAARARALEATAEIRSPRNVTLCCSTLARQGFIQDARRVMQNLPMVEGKVYEFSRWRMQGEILAAQGNYGAALPLLEDTARAASALQSKEYLARVLDLAGQHERARGVYQELVDTPWIIWNTPEFEWPGVRFLAKQSLQNGKKG